MPVCVHRVPEGVETVYRKNACVAIVVAAILLAVSIPALAGADSIPTPGELLEAHIARHGLPGGAMAVYTPGEGLRLGAHGRAGPDRPMTPDTPLFIASISKSLTAAAAMQLVERGLLDLDEPVTTYLPGFRLAEPGAADGITARHLLGHTSGISEGTYAPGVPGDASLAEAVADLGGARTMAEPGEQFAYFNAGYAVIGLLIEEMSGMTYGEYMRREIFEPLGMDSTHTDLASARAAGLAGGYGFLFGRPIPREQDFSTRDLPAGFILSTARDMGHFLEALLHGGGRGDRRILSSAGVAEMMRVEDGAPESYGLGLVVRAEEGNRIVTHGGSLDNFSSQMVLLPGAGKGAVYLFNGNHLLYGMTAHGRLVDDIVDVLSGRAPDPGIALGTVGNLLVVLYLLALAVAARDLIRLRRWRPDPRATTPERGWSVLGPALPLLGLWFLLPRAIALVVGRALPWSLFFSLAPDVVLIILTTAAAGPMVALYRLASYGREGATR